MSDDLAGTQYGGRPGTDPLPRESGMTEALSGLEGRQAELEGLVGQLESGLADLREALRGNGAALANLAQHLKPAAPEEGN